MLGAPSPLRSAIAAGVLAILLASTLVGSVGSTEGPGHSSDAGAPAAAAAPAQSPARSTAAAALPAGTTRSPVVAKVEQQIAERKFDGRNAFLPTPFTHVPGPAAGGTVTPYPLSAPGPMGLSDVGIGPGGTAYEYNTSAFDGTIHLQQYSAYSPGYAEFAEAPNWGTIQLNAVGVNISYPGSSTGTFWFQNVVHFNGTELEFEDNVWNFSSETSVIAPGTIYSHAPNGKVELQDFYYDYGPRFAVSFPFTLTLSLQLAVYDGRPAAYFNYTIANGSEPAGSPVSYDRVVFNGAAAHPPQFRVNGRAYDPYGTEYDAEFILGGDGGGTNANLIALNGTLTLARWDAATSRYSSVPSAYDHGVDSGETVTGAAAYWLGTTEHVDQGPSFLYGLWNTTSGRAGPSALPGWIHVAFQLDPTYAFLFATTHALADLPLAEANYTYAPSDAAGVASTDLPPPAAGDPYVFNAWADGFENRSAPVSANVSGPPSEFSLTSSKDVLDAPVYLDGDAQAIAYGEAKAEGTTYSSSGPTLSINATAPSLVAPFLRLNGFDYPTFVLFAAEDLNLTVHLNRFTQAANSFDYTTPYLLLPIPGAGWTQGYYFFYGDGAFSVANTTLRGNSTLYYQGVASPGAVEFYGTTGSRASEIRAYEESFGVAVIDSRGARLRSIFSGQGANAVTLVNATGSTAVDTSTDGTDFTGYPSFGAYIYYSSGDTFSGVTATNGSIGVFALASSDLTLDHVNATTPGLTADTIGLVLNDTTGVVAHDLRGDESPDVIANDSSGDSFYDLEGSDAPFIGSWNYSTDLLVEGLEATNGSQGIRLENDTSVTVQDATASGASSAVATFSESTDGAFRVVRATGGSVGVNASNASDVVLSELSAANGSLGARFANVSGVSAQGIAATNNSTGLLWNRGTDGAIANVTVGNGSLGLEVTNATHFSVTRVNATAPVLAPTTGFYVLNLLTTLLQPIAAVALHTDAYATVTNVSATYFPFAVWANDTNESNVSKVRAWDGYEAVALNRSTDVGISSVFAYGEAVGVNVSHATDVVVTASTLEDSSSYGLVVDNSTYVHVYANNFVANNGASAKGVLSLAHVQAEAINGSKVFFNITKVGNFWSDHATGDGPYVIRTTPTTLEDHYPEAAFIHQWVEFVEDGLPADTRWGFDLSGVAYNATVSLIYLPDWSLPVTAVGYHVAPTPGYLPKPAAGTVPAFTGTNRTITIDYVELYTVTFTESGLPLASPWSITLNGTLESRTGRSTTIEFNETKGTYPYAVGGSPGWTESSLARTGSIDVTDADVSAKTIAWTRVLYTVTFSETGLTGKPSWTVTLNGTPVATSATSDAFRVPNGTYPYTVTPPTGFTVRTATSSVVVNGNAMTVSVVFNATASPSHPAASIPWLEVGVGIAVVLAIVAAAAVIASRRRDSPPPPEKPFAQ